MRLMRVFVGGLLMVGCMAASRGEVFTPEPRAATTPVPHGSDAADDPAIWLHPTEPDRSLILGTDKQGGLHSYNLDGTPVEMVDGSARPNNVDILYGFPMGAHQIDLAVASTRGPKRTGVMVWRIDPATRRLIEVTADGLIRVFGKSGTPYGICTYHSVRTGRCYFLVNNARGQVEQYELYASGAQVAARKVRDLKLKSIVEGCVADDAAARFYIAEERVGIWEFDAEPDGAAAGKLIARVGQDGLRADVEGLTIYAAAGGKGYLIASSQGSSEYKIYRRDGAHAFVGTIRPRPGRFNSPRDTDGIAVLSAPVGRLFPMGLFVVQDGANRGAHQNFKMYAWEEIAGSRLIVDTSVSPRRP